MTTTETEEFSNEFARTRTEPCGCVIHTQSYIESYMGCDNDWQSLCILHDYVMPSRNDIRAYEVSLRQVAWNKAVYAAESEGWSILVSSGSVLAYEPPF